MAEAKTTRADFMKAAKAAALVGASSPRKATRGRGPEGNPTPAVSVQAHMPPSVAAGGEAPSLPVLPSAAEAPKYSEEKTMSLMRAIVAYNKYHVRRVMKDDTRWFNGVAGLARA